MNYNEILLVEKLKRKNVSIFANEIKVEKSIFHIQLLQAFIKSKKNSINSVTVFIEGTVVIG